MLASAVDTALWQRSRSACTRRQVASTDLNDYNANGSMVVRWKGAADQQGSVTGIELSERCLYDEIGQIIQ